MGHLEHVRRHSILGVCVSALDMAQTLRTIEGWIADRQPNYVCVSNVHSVMECYRDPELRRIHNNAGMVTPDGMPLVWLLQRRLSRKVERVYGPDLMLELCQLSVERGYTHFLYGGEEGVLDLLSANLRRRFPGLRIVGAYSPPFRPLSPAEDEEVMRLISEANPDIVWVGLGMPKQERWMAAHVDRLKAPVLIGVGAAFDFHAGVKRQAPRWMQRNGLEWSFRLMTEPRRLWRRYLKNNPLFVGLVIAESLGLKKRATNC
ncbi:MAG: WecB/TagA/CpsF family glycosyltransferase [Chloroflexota bacterium]|nr:WecB/TagA/CpsF family glycosyltransferase [Chloroflexota bacterium]